MTSARFVSLKGIGIISKRLRAMCSDSVRPRRKERSRRFEGILGCSLSMLNP